MNKELLIRKLLGEVIREWRHKLQYTQRELSNFSTVSLGHISDYERGTKEMSSEYIDHLMSVFRAHNLKTSDLLFRAAELAKEIEDDQSIGKLRIEIVPMGIQSGLIRNAK